MGDNRKKRYPGKQKFLNRRVDEKLEKKQKKKKKENVISHVYRCFKPLTQLG